MRASWSTAAIAALLAADHAAAHSFAAGADSYAQFVEGAGVVLSYPSLLLPPLALGVLLSLWKVDGLPSVWPLYFAGLLAGIALGPIVGPTVSIVLMALGVLIAALAAILPRHNRVEVSVLAAITGLLLTAASLEGHSFFELGFVIPFGIVFAANLVVATSAATVRVAVEKVDRQWILIGARVLASWIGAILVLMLAFALANP